MLYLPEHYKQRRASQRGTALLTALLLVLILTLCGAMFSRASMENLKIISLQDATSDTFQIAEGAVHDMIRQMSVRPNLWRNAPPLASIPSGYTSYSPLSYASTNGIPSCTGSKCLRSLYPTTGGLVKNFGPLGAAGNTVDTTLPVFSQLNDTALPTADVTLNGESGWSQVEHMDEVLPSTFSLGVDLANNPAGGSTTNNIRFRITGKTLKTVKGNEGASTVVVIVELPAV